MSDLLQTAARRYHLHHAGQLALAILGIALGVAVVLATDLANVTAGLAFETSNRQSLGNATHRIRSADGRVPAELYTELRTEAGLARAAPTAEGRVDLAGRDDPAWRQLRLVGIDPLAEGQLRDTLRGALDNDDPTALMREPGGVLLPERFAAELGIGPGDELGVLVAGEQRVATLLGLLRTDPALSAAQARYLVADLATAQEWLRQNDALQGIDLILTADEAERVRALLPAGTVLLEAGAEGRVTGQMLQAFRINLTALSLLALVVGMLLIYATMSFSVVRRRREYATLGALGMTPTEIVRSIFREALALGLFATALGLVGGALLAEGLVSLVLGTIDDLYFRTTVAGAEWSPWPFAKAAVLGIAGTLAAALPPAFEAAATPPRAAMDRSSVERASRRRAGGLLRMAALALILCAALLAWPGDSLVVAFAALFCLLACLAALTPSVTAGLLSLLQSLTGRRAGTATALAIRGASASLSRTAVAVTALSIAIATVVGVGIMIASFRASVAHWLDQTLMADQSMVT